MHETKEDFDKKIKILKTAPKPDSVGDRIMDEFGEHRKACEQCDTPDGPLCPVGDRLQNRFVNSACYASSLSAFCWN